MSRAWQNLVFGPRDVDESEYRDLLAKQCDEIWFALKSNDEAHAVSTTTIGLGACAAQAEALIGSSVELVEDGLFVLRRGPLNLDAPATHSGGSPNWDEPDAPITLRVRPTTFTQDLLGWSGGSFGSLSDYREVDFVARLKGGLSLTLTLDTAIPSQGALAAEAWKARVIELDRHIVSRALQLHEGLTKVVVEHDGGIVTLNVALGSIEAEAWLGRVDTALEQFVASGGPTGVEESIIANGRILPDPSARSSSTKGRRGGKRGAASGDAACQAARAKAKLLDHCDNVGPRRYADCVTRYHDAEKRVFELCNH